MHMSPINLAEVQEDRIQRVESGLSQVSTQVAEQGIKVGFMSQQLAEVKKDLTDKMDDLSADLTKKLDATCERIDKVTGKVEAQDDRLEKLETAESVRQKRLALIKKVIYTITVGALGVAVNELIKRAM